MHLPSQKQMSHQQSRNQSVSTQPRTHRASRAAEHTLPKTQSTQGLPGLPCLSCQPFPTQFSQSCGSAEPEHSLLLASVHTRQLLLQKSCPSCAIIQCSPVQAALTLLYSPSPAEGRKDDDTEEKAYLASKPSSGHCRT